MAHCMRFVLSLKSDHNLIRSITNYIDIALSSLEVNVVNPKHPLFSLIVITSSPMMSLILTEVDTVSVGHWHISSRKSCQPM